MSDSKKSSSQADVEDLLRRAAEVRRQAAEKASPQPPAANRPKKAASKPMRPVKAKERVREAAKLPEQGAKKQAQKKRSAEANARPKAAPMKKPELDRSTAAGLKAALSDKSKVAQPKVPNVQVLNQMPSGKLPDRVVIIVGGRHYVAPVGERHPLHVAEDLYEYIERVEGL